MAEKPLKICIMGASTSTNNRGVSALATSIVKIFLTQDPNTALSFITGSRDSKPQKIILPEKELSIPTVGYRLSPKALGRNHLLIILILAVLQKFMPVRSLRNKIISSNPVLNEMYSSDFVADIQGGDSFSDIYGLNGFIIGIIPMFLVLLLGKKLILLPQTYGPYKNTFARFLASIIIKNAYYCFSRDKDGVGQIEKIKSKSGNLRYSFCPDVAFMLDPVKPEKIQITPEIPSPVNKPLVGININGLMYNGGYTRSNMFGLAIDYKSLIIDIIKLVLAQNTRVILIPHTYGEKENVNSDPFANEEVLSLINHDSVHLLKGEYNQSEIKNIIGMCDFFIGSRMHACIAALSQGIPTVGIAYSKKFLGVFDSIGTGDMVIDCKNLQKDEILNVILKSYSNHQAFSNTFQNKLKQIQIEIMNNFQEVIILTGRK